MATREALLSADDEVELARRIEAGVVAAAVLAGERGVAPDATEAELAQVVREGEAARERFLLANVGLVRSIAATVARRLALDIDELFQEGCVALLVAVQRWDHRRGVRFAGYAGTVIQSAVLLAAGNRCGQLHLSPSQARTLRKALSVQRRLADDGRPAGLAEVAAATGRSRRWAGEVLGYVPPQQLTAAAEEIPAEISASEDEAREARMLLATLPPQEREVVRLRLGFAGTVLSAAQVGRRLGCSASTVRRVEARALARLRDGEARQRALAG